MKKETEKAAPREIVKVATTLPAVQGEDMKAALKEAYDRYVQTLYLRNRESDEVKSYLFGIQLFCGLTLAAGAGPVGMMVAGGLFAATGSGNLALHKKMNNKALEIYQNEAVLLGRKYEARQREAYDMLRTQLAALADAHVKSGEKLDTKTLSYLVGCGPKVLKDAGVSDELAITVLQARKVLQCERDSGVTEGPLTFKKLGFNAQREDHRGFLRELLERQDGKIAEDYYPAFPALQKQNSPMLEMTRGRKVKAFLLGPFADMLRMNKVAFNAAAKDEKPVLLHCAEDLERSVEKYERENSVKLDLPALRGWGYKPKVLLGPRSP